MIEVERILKRLNAESGMNVRAFLSGKFSEEELRRKALEIKQKYYDALVEKRAIKASEGAHRIIVEEGKGMDISVGAAVKCKKGEITWKELVNICSTQVLPLARQEAEDASKV